nr:ribonuclease H-like domain-containing protein [Tanacetum cinerariifolium]
DIPDIIPPAIPTNPAVQLLHEPITPIHNTPIQHHPDAAQVQTTKNQAHSPPPSTFAVQQPTPTPTQSTATQNEPVAHSPIIIPDPHENSNPILVHPMVTRFRIGTNRPTERLNLYVSSVSFLPKSYRDAFSDPNWQNAMRDEYHALVKNKSWILVPRPPDTNIVRCIHGTDTAYLLLYVDDIVLTASFGILLQQIIRSLHQEFAMTDMGSLNYFLDYGLHLFSSSTTNLVAYSDADWAGCPTTRRSTSGYCVFLGNNLLSWSSKRQSTLSRSSAEAEYRVVAETCWLCNLLRELHTPLSFATLVYCDNVSAVYLSCNPVQHQRTKHIEIDIHFVTDLVVAGQVRVLHVPFRYQYADIFTKGLPSALFKEFRSSLSVRCSSALTAGEC